MVVLRDNFPIGVSPVSGSADSGETNPAVVWRSGSSLARESGVFSTDLPARKSLRALLDPQSRIAPCEPCSRFIPGGEPFSSAGGAEPIVAASGQRRAGVENSATADGYRGSAFPAALCYEPAAADV